MKADKVREMSSEELTAKERELSEQLQRRTITYSSGTVYETDYNVAGTIPTAPSLNAICTRCITSSGPQACSWAMRRPPATIT